MILAADIKGSGGRMITDDPNMQVRVHYSTNIYLTVTNFGLIGSQDGNWIDPESGDPAPGAEFPGGTGLEYLFEGALWIGAEIDTIDQYGNPVLDTLVSVGHDGWWDISELMPPSEGEESLWEQQVIGDEEYFAVFYDTVTNPNYVIPDPNDQRAHLPMGLKVIRNSAGWSSPDYNEFFIINYIIENIGARYLHNAWAGVYYDGDVLHESEDPYQGEGGAQDDLCGYIQHGDYGIAWIADNDGQPYDGAYDWRSPRGLTGLILLGASESGIETNFNWWISNIDADYDWGPQWQSNFDIWGIFPGGGKGTPGGDKAKYQVMSNGEHDYDQVWCALDHTGDGWITEPSNAGDLAKGYDTRFLISYGPLDIPPGDVETLTVALIGGNNLHLDPSNYNQNLRYGTDDSLSIAQYYDNLDFSDLLIKADSAISFYENNFANIPPGPPTNLTVSGWSENQISLRWNPVYPPNLTEYRIYRGTEPGVYDPEKITPDGFIDSVYTDLSVENNVTYYYVICSASQSGLQGGYSNEVFVNSGQPQTPSGLEADAGNTEVFLNWNVNPDSDLVGYIIYRAEPGEDLSVIDTTTETSYADGELVNGLAYSYSIRAFDQHGNISFFSDTVNVVPMGLDSGILLINSNMGSLNPDYDSMIVFYEDILSNYHHEIIDSRPETLPEIASYSTVIFCKEQVRGYLYFDLYDSEGILSTYLDHGGNLLIAGTRQLVLTLGFSGQLLFEEDQFPNRYLNLTGVEFPGIYNTEFSGGESAASPFGDFSVDSVRAERIEVPPGENYGRLFGIGVLIPNDSDEVIYNYVSAEPDTSNLDGRPVAIIHSTDIYNTASLEFPLYYVEEPQAYDIVRAILEAFGEVPTGVIEDSRVLPETAVLLESYPNPFNAQCTIRYAFASETHIVVKIYDILGRRIATLLDEDRPAGHDQLVWDASDFPSGIYFARLEAGTCTASVKMVLLK